jgi:Spy/CpxP family protein refolding chaperone
MINPTVSKSLTLVVLFLAPFLLQPLALAQDGTVSDGVEETQCPHHTDGQYGMHHYGTDGFAGIEGMGDSLGLTETQKQELAALVQIYQPRIKELLERTGQSRELLSLAPNDPNYSLEAAKMSQLAGATASEMVILLSELQSNAFALLSNEQQARYMELRAEQRERMEQCRAEMEARRESGETGHSCAACEWLKADDAAQQDTAE